MFKYYWINRIPHRINKNVYILLSREIWNAFPLPMPQSKRLRSSRFKGDPTRERGKFGVSSGCLRDLLRSISCISRGESRVPPVLTPRTPKLLELLSRIVRDLRNRTFRPWERDEKRIGNGPPKGSPTNDPAGIFTDLSRSWCRTSSVKFIGTHEEDRSRGLFSLP